MTEKPSIHLFNPLCGAGAVRAREDGTPCTGCQSIIRQPERQTTIPAGIHNSYQCISNKLKSMSLDGDMKLGYPGRTHVGTGRPWKLQCLIEFIGF